MKNMFTFVRFSPVLLLLLLFAGGPGEAQGFVADFRIDRATLTLYPTPVPLTAAFWLTGSWLLGLISRKNR